MMKFDGNLAWKQASAAMKANRDLLLALAGVFFFLPSFALIMLIKQPQVPPNATPEQMVAIMQPFVATAMPLFVIGSVVQALGQLTLIELFGHGRQSTVGEALRKGLGALITYVLLQLLIGFLTSAVLVLTVSLGSVVSPILGVLLATYVVSQVYGRFMTGSVVVVLERQRNPFTALARAIGLSRGNGFRIGNFLFLLAIAFVVVFMVLTIVTGVIVSLALGQGRAGEIVTGFFSSAVTALAVSYFTAITVAIYRQLAGETPESISAPFD
jgi:hypothetical protein